MILVEARRDGSRINRLPPLFDIFQKYPKRKSEVKLL